jgi:hypothetical protein
VSSKLAGKTKADARLDAACRDANALRIVRPYTGCRRVSGEQAKPLVLGEIQAAGDMGSRYQSASGVLKGAIP